MAQTVKNLPALWETRARSLGQEYPLEKEMVTHSSILAWRIPWSVETVKLQYMRSPRVRHDWVTNTFTFHTFWNSWTVWMELAHWKRLWCWEGLRAGGEGDDGGWDGWMASLTRWTWVWVNSRSWWWTGRPGVLRFMGSQTVGHYWATALNWTETSSRAQGLTNIISFYPKICRILYFIFQVIKQYSALPGALLCSPVIEIVLRITSFPLVDGTSVYTKILRKLWKEPPSSGLFLHLPPL